MRLAEVALTLLCAWAGVQGVHAQEHRLQFGVERQDRRLHVQAAFHLPLAPCEAYRYLSDYDAARQVTGVVDSRATRLDTHRVRVERWAEERVLLFTVRLHSVVEYLEQPYVGTEFHQVSGDARAFEGRWRLEPEGQGTWFRFDGVMEPDSAFPMPVVQHFVGNRMRERFGEMARNGARRQGLPVAPCL